MTTRPIFISTYNVNQPVRKEIIEFEWIKGMSYSQKCKRREEFHRQISKKYELNRILEVSTKSNKDIGIKLSALNLKYTYNNITKTVEEIYQESKCYDENDRIVCFKYQDIMFENIPRNMYYDWLYISALWQNKQLINELEQYDIFTDIEFNPKKSINTQARAVAIFKTLFKNGIVEELMSDIKKFKDYYKRIDLNKKDENIQLNFFE